MKWVSRCVHAKKCPWLKRDTCRECLGAVVCMGDPEGGPQPSGLVPEQAAAYAVSFTESRSVDNERWKRAEQRTAELITRIKGTRYSEKRRKDVADYVGNLIRKCFDCEVQCYTFGSVPLKTYLPDGDIDLTILSPDPDPRLKDTWANVVRSTLEKAERNQDGKFRVKEVQYINAEVKLIKCHVENIVVDISFNQFGGLCTLCFLEEVDREIGKDHFFKRSIILVKAWCYYESTMLGAHHGLISTYALETLVLYIFHVFHSSLRGPLEVLLRFLEFFSKFDWHKYAVSVWGPVPLSSLPEMIGGMPFYMYTEESPRKDGGKLLLSKDFLDECLKEYAVFVTGQDSNHGRAFTAKYLNVVDPLRAGNNLGRSVNQTNFNRIVKALGHSANRLLTILLDSSKDIDEYFKDMKTGFFKRTNDRLDQFEHKRPDAVDGRFHFATTQPAGLHQNGSSVVRHVDESATTGRSYGAETYYVHHNFQKKPEGWTLELDSRSGIFNHLGQTSGNQGDGFHLTGTSSAGSDTSFPERASWKSEFDSGASGAGSSGGNSSASESSCVPHSRGKPSEAVEKPTGLNTKLSMDSMVGINQNIAKVSRQWVDARNSVDNTLSRENRSSYTQTNFENNGALLGSSESSSSESSRGTANILYEGPIPVRRSSPSHSIDKDSSCHTGWVGEQPLYVATDGVFDGQGYVQHRGQDSASGGSIPVPAIPHAQIHHGQLQMQLATSVGMPSSKGHLSTLSCPPPPVGLHSVNISPSSIMGDSPLGLGPRAGQYYAMQLPRGPPAPPLPSGYFHGPPLAHRLPVGEIPNAVNRSQSSYPVQQGEDKSFEHQHVWQQMEQMQVHDHHLQYGFQPVSTISAAVSLPQHLNSENSFVVSSASSIVTSIPFHFPANLSVSRSQAVCSPPGNFRIVHNGSRTNVESLANSAAGQQLLEDLEVEGTGKSLPDDGEMGNSIMTRGKLPSLVGSEAGTQPNKNSKPSKERRIPSKGNSASNQDVDSRIYEDGVPSVSAESSSHWLAQGIADDTVLMGQGYQQLLSVTGPVLGPPAYSHLSSSLPPHGTGMMVSELSYPVPHMVLTPRTAVGHSSVTSQPSNQTPSLSVGIPNGPSTSPWPSVTEFGNGLSSLPTTQHQRRIESVTLPPSVYYSTGNHYPLLSMYNTAHTNQVYPLPHSSDPTILGLDLFGGLHSSNSLDSYIDTSPGQGEDLPLIFPQQARVGVADRLRRAGVATSSISRSETTASDTQALDAGDPTCFSGNLLSSDFGNLLHNLDYARWCQIPRLPVPMMYGQQQYFNPTTKYYPNYHPWESSGRPLTPNMLGNMISYGHGLVQGPPSMSTSTRMVGNFPRPFTGSGSYSGDEPPKSHGGTGTYLPSLKPPYIRDRQSSGSGRNQHGGYSQERGDRVDREANQVHGTRFRGSGRSKYEARSQSNNVGVERNIIDVKGGERGKDMQRQHEGLRRSSIQSGLALTSPVTVVSQVTAGIPVETYSVPIVTGSGKSSPCSGIGGETIPSSIVYLLEKRVPLVTDPLEFGSLGPVQVGASQGGGEMDHGDTLRTRDQVNAQGRPGFIGLSLALGDRSSQGPSSPKERVTQRPYQLKQEDFPPLSSRGQHGSSSSGLNSGSSTSSQSSSCSGFVVMPSW